MGDAAQSGRDGLWPFPGHDGGGAVRLMMPVVVEEIELRCIVEGRPFS